MVSKPTAPAPIPTPPAVPVSAATPGAPASPSTAAPVSSPASVPPMAHDEAQAMRRVLAELQRQVDAVLEVRLRELLAPILSRAADALVRDARKELTTAMRDAVSRAIAQELARRQERGPR